MMRELLRFSLAGILAIVVLCGQSERRSSARAAAPAIAAASASGPSTKRPAPMLDAIARAPLWAEGLDFGHGTGHGVGYFLNVHEGPQTISRSLPDASMAMQEGMITSVEPGIYRPGQWGVRIENLVLNVAAEKNSFGDFLRFDGLRNASR